MIRRQDDRLRSVPMTPVRCHACTAQVEVRKSSREQTSIQWNAVASMACLERPAGNPQRPEPLFAGCGPLRDSVAAAIRDGSLRLADRTVTD
ncbi:ferredoxin [Nocardia sp. NPDC004582]